jgi:hypothetical protein
LRRNKFIFEKNFTHPQVVYKEAYGDYCRVHLQEEHGGNISEVASPASLIDWQPPLIGVIKVNRDASLNMKDSGIGIVARDHHGDFMGVRGITKKVVGSSKLAETMAALEAVLFCKKLVFFMYF